jgi:osmotically-inducible protein OsmY
MTSSDEEIRQAIATLAKGEAHRVSVDVDCGLVTLFGDPEYQQELGELASTVCAILAVTQVQTRFWAESSLVALRSDDNASLKATA